MKKLLFTIAILLPITSIAQIRGTSWGDSISSVKSTNTGTIFQEGKADDDTEYIAYEEVLAGYETLIAYYFFEDKLYQIRYVFAEQYSNKNDFITQFNKIDEILEDKYTPLKQDKVWLNNLYKDDYEDWGTAISIGHYVLQSKYETEETEILHILSGSNYDISHNVSYKSIELKGQVEAFRNKKNASDF